MRQLSGESLRPGSRSPARAGRVVRRPLDVESMDCLVVYNNVGIRITVCGTMSGGNSGVKS